MLKFSYLGVLVFTVCASFWLQIVLSVRVLERFARLICSVLPVAILFLCWDAYAISHGHWHFDTNQIVGIYSGFHIPIEEILFFLVVPTAAIMTLEAVRRVKKNWLFGDENK